MSQTMTVDYGRQWWIEAAGGESMVIPKIGFPPFVAEAIFLKYCEGVFERHILWLVLAYFKVYPNRVGETVFCLGNMFFKKSVF